MKGGKINRSKLTSPAAAIALRSSSSERGWSPARRCSRPINGPGGMYVLALVIDSLAPAFGSRKDFVQALKVAAYSATPYWIAAALTIVPSLWIITVLVGLYSLYLLFVGLPIAMKTPPEKAPLYFVVVLMAILVLTAAIFIVTSLALPGPVRGF